MTEEVNLIGGFYQAKSLPFSAQDTVNWLPVPSSAEGSRSPIKLRGLPGYSQFGSTVTPIVPDFNPGFSDSEEMVEELRVILPEGTEEGDFLIGLASNDGITLGPSSSYLPIPGGSVGVDYITFAYGINAGGGTNRSSLGWLKLLNSDDIANGVPVSCSTPARIRVLFWVIKGSLIYMPTNLSTIEFSIVSGDITSLPANNNSGFSGTRMLLFSCCNAAGTMTATNYPLPDAQQSDNSSSLRQYGCLDIVPYESSYTFPAFTTTGISGDRRASNLIFAMND